METRGIDQMLSELRSVSQVAQGKAVSPADAPAGGVNFADVLIRRNEYAMTPPLPSIPGSEVAGEVDHAQAVVVANQHHLGMCNFGHCQRCTHGKAKHDCLNEIFHVKPLKILRTFLFCVL